MQTAHETISRRLDRFQDACRVAGLKATHQRLEIYRQLAATDEHPDAETIFRGVRERIPTISLDTVYRNLRLMADRGLISIVGLSQERLRFDANQSPHHHFVCMECGAIRDFESSELAELVPPAGALRHGRPLSLQLHVKGICRACEEAGN